MLHSWELTWHSPWKWMLWNSYDRFLLGAWPIFRGQWLLVLGSVDVPKSSVHRHCLRKRTSSVSSSSNGSSRTARSRVILGTHRCQKQEEVPGTGPRHSGCSWCIPASQLGKPWWISLVHPLGTAPTNQFTPEDSHRTWSHDGLDDDFPLFRGPVVSGEP